MISDPIATARLVAREVRNGHRDGGPTKIAVARRTYATDPADLWDALTNPERLPRWFAPVTGELELGGRFQVQGNAGGVVEHCEEPVSFTVTWEMAEATSWVTVTLVPTDAGTTLELAHEAPFDPDSDFVRQFGPGAVGVGWDLALVGLGIHIDSGESVDPAQSAVFTLTEPGIELVRVAAAEWGEAAIAGGDQPEAAQAAAQRTFAFYTTDPSQGPDPA